MDDLNVYEDEAYLGATKIAELRRNGWRVHKLINGYIRFLRGRIGGDSPRVKETTSDEFIDDELSEVLSDRFNSSSLQRSNE
jgi:hypothetical protein